ncbi:MAG: hypothetical protein RLZZ58_2044 [Pseudomonadota bacterium]
MTGTAPAPVTSLRRHIAILFSDLSDSTRIAADMEPEQYADLLQRLRDLVNAIVPRHGGEIVRIDGDGVLCLFGYPEAHEDDGRRATEAAIDIHAAVAALDADFAAADAGIRMHSGVHAGVVLLRTGDMIRGRYELLGDATNVAARLCDHARADEIIVSESTLGSDRHFFRTGPRRRVAVSGHDSAIAAFEVQGREEAATRHAARSRHGLTPFAGRDEERARLAAWLSGSGKAGQEPGTALPLMLLHGPAGIGKTRLIDQFTAEARQAGWRVAHGYCESYLSARPMQPFLQLADMLSEGAAPVGIESLSAEIPAQVARALSTGPLLLVIDDWQWADDASRNLMALLLLSAGGSPRLRILLASREADPGLAQDIVQQSVATTALPPLDHGASERTITNLLPTPGPFTIARIEAAAGGSPLLIEELCHAWQAGSSDSPVGTTGNNDIRGAWFDLAVQNRFSALDPADAMLLRLAAVIGHMVPMALLAAVNGSPVGVEQRARLQVADFLYPSAFGTGDAGEVLRFKHGLTRDAIYAGIGLSERRALHARVLAALEVEAEAQRSDSLLDGLAYHSAATDQSDRALAYAIRAGDAALIAGALDRAQAHYRVGFALVAKLDDGTARRDHSWALLNKYGMACLVDPAPDQIGELEPIGRLFKAHGDIPGLIRTAYWQGAIAYGIGACKQSVALLRESLALANQHGAQRYIDQIGTKLAQSLFASGRYAEAADLFAAVLPIIRATRGRNDEEALAYALASCGFMMADIGDLTASDALYREQEDVAASDSAPVLASIMGQRAAICLWRGEWAQALALAEVNLTNSTKTRARYQTMMGRALAAYAQWQIDRDEGAAAALEAAGRWFLSDTSSSQRSSLVHGWLADVMAARGDRVRTRFHAAQAVQRVRRGGDRLGEGMAWRALARLEQHAGNAARADHYADMAMRSADARPSHREAAEATLCRAELMLARGDVASGRAQAKAAVAAFAAMGLPLRADSAAALLTNR